jgi:alkanesulfonate monooxygenase SsuD/methylene tetrahydromethanopterin reductase-like flavin-dependent oxidoreductase (luciferase family)
MRPITFGIFDHIERRANEPLSQTYEGRLRMLEAADAAGFHAYHLAEHHATPLSMAPSPGIFLAALCQRTRRLRFGPLVYLLPLYNPIRLATEICMLDNLSGGRLEIGVGRGVSPFELAYFNVPFMESAEIFEEALDLIVSLLRGKRVSHRGRHFEVRGFPMELHPVQVPNPPFWYGVASPDRAAFAASRGMNMVALGPPRAVKASTDRFREVWEASRSSDRNLNPHVNTPWIGAGRHVYIAESDGAAFEAARPAYRIFHDNIQKLWRDFFTTTIHFTPDVEVACRAGAAIVGSPARVREEIERLQFESGINYLAPAFAWGGLTHEQSMRSLRLFIDEVMPHFADAAKSASAVAR